MGGGGLLAGSAVAAKHERPTLALYGVEPAAGNDWQISFQRGERREIAPPEDTICDGLRVTSPGALPWPIVHSLADWILTVSDDEVRTAMRLLFSHAKAVVEPSGAVALAAAIARRAPLRDKRVGVILSGGNVDPDQFKRLISERT